MSGPEVFLEVFQSNGPEKGIQVSLSGPIHGVRLAGPSFIGNSTLLKRIPVTPRLIELMQPYLDMAAAGAEKGETT